MKKLLLVSALFAASSAIADDTGPGCGWGTKIFEGQTGVAPHIFAATTNGTSYNQMFGISSGSIGCDPENVIESAVTTYLDHNMDTVAQDMARGEGEALVSLAQVIGIPAKHQALFYETTQENFEVIFKDHTTTRADVVKALHSVMSQHSELSGYAKNLTNYS